MPPPCPNWRSHGRLVQDSQAFDKILKFVNKVYVRGGRGLVVRAAAKDGLPRINQPRVRGSNPAAAVLSRSFFQWTERSGGIDLDPYRCDLFREASLSRPRSKRRKSSLRNKKKKMEMNRKMDSNQEDILVI